MIQFYLLYILINILFSKYITLFIINLGRAVDFYIILILALFKSVKQESRT